MDYEGLASKAKSRGQSAGAHQGRAEEAGPVAGKEAVLSVGEKEASSRYREGQSQTESAEALL